MDDLMDDPRLDHQLDPPRPIEMDQLFKRTGVLYWKLDLDTPEGRKTLDSIKIERGYSYEDTIEISPDKLPNYEEKLKIFYAEHLHTDEEIRLVLAGSGYFDVRDSQDAWIRIHVHPGDLLVLPLGIYHRFTLDDKNYIKANRLFVGEPIWTPHNRPCDEMEARQNYVKSISALCTAN